MDKASRRAELDTRLAVVLSFRNENKAIRTDPRFQDSWSKYLNGREHTPAVHVDIEALHILSMPNYPRRSDLAASRNGSKQCERQRGSAMECRGVARGARFPHWSADGRPGPGGCAHLHLRRVGGLRQKGRRHTIWG